MSSSGGRLIKQVTRADVIETFGLMLRQAGQVLDLALELVLLDAAMPKDDKRRPSRRCRGIESVLLLHGRALYARNSECSPRRELTVVRFGNHLAALCDLERSSYILRDWIPSHVSAESLIRPTIPTQHGPWPSDKEIFELHGRDVSFSDYVVQVTLMVRDRGLPDLPSGLTHLMLEGRLTKELLKGIIHESDPSRKTCWSWEEKRTAMKGFAELPFPRYCYFG